MSEPLTFSFEGTPVSKGRPRTRVIPASRVRPAFAHIYTDEKTQRFERQLARVAALAMRGRDIFEGPISVSMRFRFEPPKSATKRDRAAMLAGDIPYSGSKDLDNLGKAASDALNGVVWRDDVQIIRLFLTKAVSTNAGIDFRIAEL